MEQIKFYFEHIHCEISYLFLLNNVNHSLNFAKFTLYNLMVNSDKGWFLFIYLCQLLVYIIM